MIISVDAKTDFDKIHDRFMIKKKKSKNTEQTRIERELPKPGIYKMFCIYKYIQISTKCSVSTKTQS